MSDLSSTGDANLSIRVVSINFTEHRTALVQFELVSNNTLSAQLEEKIIITQDVPLYTIVNTSLPDHNAIVREAAKSLEGNFKTLIAMLKNTYSSP